MLKFAYYGTRNVAIYACTSGKFLDYACEKYLTNIMSGWKENMHVFFYVFKAIKMKTLFECLDEKGLKF